LRAVDGDVGSIIEEEGVVEGAFSRLGEPFHHRTPTQTTTAETTTRATCPSQ
jgi:hypothetical protein